MVWFEAPISDPMMNLGCSQFMSIQAEGPILSKVNGNCSIIPHGTQLFGRSGFVLFLNGVPNGWIAFPSFHVDMVVGDLGAERSVTTWVRPSENCQTRFVDNATGNVFKKNSLQHRGNLGIMGPRFESSLARNDTA